MEEIIQFWKEKRKLPFPLSAEETLEFWKREDKPYEVRVEAVKNYGENVDILVETGTYYGQMVDAMLNNYKRIISIELDQELYINAKKKFSGNQHVSILHGDSGNILPDILLSIKAPCLFWLDGHYVPGTKNTARGVLDTPILQELDAILRHEIKGHVILIDDARCFIGPNPVLNHYPTIQELKQYVINKRPDLSFEINDDIIRIF